MTLDARINVLISKIEEHNQFISSDLLTLIAEKYPEHSKKQLEDIVAKLVAHAESRESYVIDEEIVNWVIG